MSDNSSTQFQEGKYTNLVFVMKVVTVCLLIVMAVPSNRKAFAEYVSSVVTDGFFSNSVEKETEVQVANETLYY